MPAEIELTVGTLPPPACYASEQERADAYVAAMTATLVSTDEWSVGQNPPADTDLYWLQLDIDDRPVMAYNYVDADAAWVPWFAFPVFRVATGAAGAYSITNSPAMTTVGEAYQTGRTYVFKANHASTGATTLNVDGLGAKAIKIKVTDDTVANTIKIDQIVTVIYDGINFQMISAVGGSSIAASDIVPGTDRQFIRTVGTAAAWETSLYKTPVVSGTTIPAHGTPITIAHGLGVQPVMFGMNFVCTDALGDMGYSEFEEIPVTGTTEISSDDDDNIPTVWATTTVVGYLTCTQSLTNPRVANKATGVIGSIDPTKWKLVAWAMK